jgi:outer membrane protein assembly factor BamB
MKTTKQSMKLPPTLTYHPEIHNFVFWDGSAGPHVYTWADGAPLSAWKFANGTLSADGKGTILPQGNSGGHPGGMMTVSSNGNMAGTGIIWATVSTGGNAWHDLAPAKIYAFDAADVTKAPLWMADLGNMAKFSPPIVANGKVYVATFSGKLNVYGLK